MFSSISPETRIVIIDDILANLRLLESSVKAFGLRHVTSFTDSAAGLEWLRSNPWDLLLLDLDMPAPDGFEILGHLGDRNRSRCPVIILTALNDPENRRRGLELGANDYLTKPVDLPELLLRMRNCLSLSHATASLEQLNRDLESRYRPERRNCRKATVRRYARWAGPPATATTTLAITSCASGIRRDGGRQTGHARCLVRDDPAGCPDA